MSFRLWDCLNPDSQNRIRLYQLECQPDWTPPSSEDSSRIQVHFDINELEEERLEREIKPIMVATPGEVKHKWK